MKEEHTTLETYWWDFEHILDDIPLPQRFPFPFHYEPHSIAQTACRQLQSYLTNQTDWEYDFGIDDSSTSGQGKMFGILVVQKTEGQLGFLAAFSGKLGTTSDVPPFVPPFYDRFDEQGWFRQGEEALNEMNRKIKVLEQTPDFLELQEQYKNLCTQRDKEVEECRIQVRQAKQNRNKRRQEANGKLEAEALLKLEEALRQESIRFHFILKDLKRNWRSRLETKEQELEQHKIVIGALKKKRKQQSAALQQRLFDQYQFLNQKGKTRGLSSIFQETVFQIPPSGAGDCAAPKLLQFAFQNNLQPIAMAEFWWGISPKSAIRKHGQFYPACRGKCEPILKHMLDGMEVEENPIVHAFTPVDKLDIVYEDEYLMLINKPAGFLSVPGKTWTDSVYLRIRQAYPHADGPLLVHRLDMATSGLILIAKASEIHKKLQQQFIKRTVKKRYTALLDGLLDIEEGTIDLPLRVDLEDRPRQLVCFEHGKAARTHWKVVGQEDGKTRIHFFPVTGRTHQLRVHAAHPMGLNTPIVGDKLYGISAERLFLHAEELSFVHPVLQEEMKFIKPADF
ncbi:MAG: pseudouridine synthase [Chitinophagales bacterium]|nr:pseudouridine synthase [Chitinophagales bacterium]